MSRYDAFISYSHAEGGEIARRLQAGVEKFAKPWYRARGLRLFLDTNSLTADPGLWSSIESALDEAKWFILVTSPNVVQSQWVDREIRWWLANRSPSRLLIVVAAGHLEWDSEANDFDSKTSTALPPALRGVFEEEPHWVMVPDSVSAGPRPERELGEVIVDVAAPLRGISKEKLVAAAEREHRRTMRWVRGAIAVLSLLLLAAIAAGVVALHQRGAAKAQANVALSRQIASVSEATAGTDLSAAMLLAVRAYRTNSNPQTRAALFNASTSSPHLVRFIGTGSKVSALAGSGDGKAVVAGLANGRVLIWSSSAGEPEQLLRLPEAVSDVALSHDGSVVAATDGTHAFLWRRGSKPAPLVSPSGLACTAVGVSPSGRTIVYASENPSNYHSAATTVVRTANLANREVHPDSSAPNYIAVPSDRRVLTVSVGSWQWRRLSDWSAGPSGSIVVGAHDFAVGTSADGRFITETNGASRIPVWSTLEGRPRPGELESEPTASAEVPLPQQVALALSPDGSKLATTGPGEIYVTPVAAQAGRPGVEEGDAADRPAALTGQSADLVAFADDSHLVTAEGNRVGIWDTEQLDRLAKPERVPLEFGCEECGAPTVSVSPDGKRVAVLNNSGSFGFVQALQGDAKRQMLPVAEFEFTYGLPIWQLEGHRVFFPVWSQLDSRLPPRDELPSGVSLWRAAGGASYELTDGLAADGKTAITVDDAGNVYWQNLESGVSVDSSPAETSREEDNAGALSSVAPLLAVVHEGRVTVEELPRRNVVGDFKTGGFPTVTFGGGHLLVQLDDGRLQVWDERGTRLERTLSGGAGAGWLSVSSDGALVARSRNDGAISLEDLQTGLPLAVFPTRGASFFYKTGLAFTPDDSTLVAISEAPGIAEGGELVERDISDTALIRAACEAAGRKLTAAEWRSLVGTEPPADLSCR